jgi:hypothetical protein
MTKTSKIILINMAVMMLERSKISKISKTSKTSKIRMTIEMT